MKKLFLAVALVAASLSVNATSFGVASLADFNSKYTAVGDATVQEEDDATTKAFKDAQMMYASGSYTINGISFSGGSTTAGSVQWKVYSNYIQPNGAGRVITIPTNVGDVVNIVVKDAFDFANSTVTGGTSTSTSVVAGGTFSLTANSTSVTITSVTVGSTTYKPKFMSVNVTTTGIKDAISSDLLNKAGDALVNPTALSVEVYSVTGVKILTSNKTSINVSELPTGVYVAKTDKGVLKFIK